MLFIFIFTQKLFFAQSPPVITDDAFVAGYNNNNPSSFFWSHTTGTNSNRILLVFITTAKRNGTASGITSVTYGVNNLTLLASSEVQPALKSYLYYMLDPPSGTYTITVTPVSSTNDFAAGSSTFYNVKQEAPSYNTSGGNASNASGSISTPYVNDLLLGFCGSDNNTNGVGTGQTEKYSAGSATKSYVNLSTKTSTSSTASFSITISATADFELILARLTPIGAAVLPATISNYELNCKENLTSFNWSTASEINNDFFTIEKSEDALNYSEIATIDGNGTTDQEHHYQFTDEELNDKPFYYRLKQTDFDGKSETFKPLLSTCFETNETTYFPNPVKDKIHLNTSNDFTHASIFSIDGKRLIESEINSLNNQIDLSNFSTGMYFIQLLNTKKKTDFIKIIKE